MKDFYIRCLGSPVLLKNGTAITFQRNKSLILIIYLHIKGKSYTRDELINFFWPDLDRKKALANLRTILSECRTSTGIDLFSSGEQIISLKPGFIGSDYADFVSLAGSSFPEDNRQAEELYQGAFLKGLVISRSRDFDDWQFEIEQEISILYTKLLQKLLNTAQENKDAESEAYYLKKLIKENPFREDYRRSIMKLYSDNGDYESAVHQFKMLRKLLQEEGGGLPEKKTQELLIKIETERKTATEERFMPRPSGNKPAVRKKLIPVIGIIIAGILLAVSAAGYFIINVRGDNPPQTIAVLPFNFLCNDDNAASFAESFTIEMINSLAVEDYISVKPAQSVSMYKDSILSVKQIARQLDVDYIIDGSAMSYDECIRFSVQLIETETDECVWVGSYNCRMDSSLKTELEVIEYLKTNIMKEIGLEYRRFSGSN